MTAKELQEWKAWLVWLETQAELAESQHLAYSEF